MTCKDCGQELTKVGELTEKETEDYIYLGECYSTAQQALNPDVINKMDFSEGQVFEYFKAVYDNMAKAKFLEHMLIKNLKKRLNMDSDIQLYMDESGKQSIYIHANK